MLTPSLVLAALSAALAFALNLPGLKNREAGRKMSWEEARRDVLVVEAMLAGGGGVEMKVGRVEAVQTSAPAYHNTTSTNVRDYDYVFRCGGVEDVRAAVIRASRLRVCRIDVVGGENQMRSTTPSMAANLRPAARLELPNMSRLIRFDAGPSADSSTVTVESGMTLRTLLNLLQNEGFTLPSLPILLDQTVGGCIATGSHGSSLAHGTISDSVVAVTVILFGTGEVVRLEEDEELMRLARCSVGSMGVVVNVTLQVVQARKFARSEVVVRTAAEVDEVCRQHEHCWIHWIEDKGYAICLDESEEGSTYSGRNWYPYSKEVRVSE